MKNFLFGRHFVETEIDDDGDEVIPIGTLDGLGAVLPESWKAKRKREHLREVAEARFETQLCEDYGDPAFIRAGVDFALCGACADEEIGQAEEPDEEVTGTVVASNADEGIVLDLGERGEGWLPPVLLGQGSRRAALLAKWRPGISLTFGVSGTDAETGRTLLHLLYNRRTPCPNPAKPIRDSRTRGSVSRNAFCLARVRWSDFDVVALDGANIIGQVDDDHLRAVILDRIIAFFERHGKTVVVFLETTILAWAKKHSPLAYERIDALSRDRAHCVRTESSSSCDAELLLFVKTYERAIGISCDRYRDHEASDVVRSRIHGLTFCCVPGIPPAVQFAWLDEGERIELQ